MSPELSTLTLLYGTRRTLLHRRHQGCGAGTGAKAILYGWSRSQKRLDGEAEAGV